MRPRLKVNVNYRSLFNTACSISFKLDAPVIGIKDLIPYWASTLRNITRKPSLIPNHPSLCKP